MEKDFYFQKIIHSGGAELFTLVNAFVIDVKIGHRQALLLDTAAMAALELFPDLHFLISRGEGLLRNCWCRTGWARWSWTGWSWGIG